MIITPTDIRSVFARHSEVDIGLFGFKLNEEEVFQQRLLSKFKVNPENGCWDWTGNVSLKGYGQYYVPGRFMESGIDTRVNASRASLVLEYGLAFEPGLEADHLCWRPICIYPDHLEFIPKAENIRRSWARRRQMRGDVA